MNIYVLETAKHLLMLGFKLPGEDESCDGV